MKPIWMIQGNTDGVDTNSLACEVIMQKMLVTFINHKVGKRIDFSKCRQDQCVICYGDIDFVRQFRARAPFVPGAWCNFENMKCSTYYAHLGKYLLNEHYMMMPVGELPRRWDFLTRASSGKPLFIRPDIGSKPFTGYVVAPGEKDKIESLVQAVGPELLVIVSPEVDIQAEWRFVICKQKVVAGCQYLPVESPLYTDASLRLARVIAENEWQPDLCYTVDIASVDDRVRLLEINSFSCAGFYSCDVGAIVKKASEVAEFEWDDYDDPINR